MPLTRPTDSKSTFVLGLLATGLRKYRALLLALVVVYIAMAALSAVRVDTVLDHPFEPSQWQTQEPVFLVQRAMDGSLSFNTDNHINILGQIAIMLTLGVGMTFVILTGGIDLSVGSLLALCNVVFVQLVLHLAGDQSPTMLILLVAMAASIATGLVCGMVNGWLTVRLTLPSFIVTLGMMFIARGLAQLVSGGQTHSLARPSGLAFIIPVGISFLAVVVGAIYLGTTTAGRRIFAVGGNLLASEYAGVRTGRVRIMCFAFSGLCAGLAGMIYWARVGSGSHLAGEGQELYAIAVVVLGGTRLAGGEGSIAGTFLGALIIGVLANGLEAAGVPIEFRKISVGCVLIVAAYIDSRRGQRGIAAVT